MKYYLDARQPTGRLVAPARERGLKFFKFPKKVKKYYVAPARERGLKLFGVMHLYLAKSRSREGAWIEMVCHAYIVTDIKSLPRGSVD